MGTKVISITQFRPGNDAPAADKVGTLRTAPPEEVSGRAIYQRYGQCTNCGFVGIYNYDTNAYQAYRCANCGTILVS